jgi:hypothetical protein
VKVLTDINTSFAIAFKNGGFIHRLERSNVRFEGSPLQMPYQHQKEQLESCAPQHQAELISRTCWISSQPATLQFGPSWCHLLDM